MSPEAKLAKKIASDPTLKRRVADIEVEEITLTKKGALGDVADAVVLLKEGEPDTAPVEKPEEEVALEKEEAVEESAVVEEVVLDADSAVSFLKKESLTDEQKEAVLDLALSLHDSADLEKDLEPTDSETTEAVAPVAEAGSFPAEAMELLKTMNETLSKLVPDEDEDEESEEVSLTKGVEPATPEPSVIEVAEQLLRKSQDEKRAQGRAKQEADVQNQIKVLSDVLSDLGTGFAKTQRTLLRELGEDA